MLVSFYRKVRPQITGWQRVAALAPEVPQTRDLGRNLWCWILGCIMIYAVLFGMGKLLLERWASGSVLLLIATVSAWLMWRELNHVKESDPGVLKRSPVEPSEAR